MGEEAQKLLGGRVRIIKSVIRIYYLVELSSANAISVWRPIKHPVEDSPLAWCDGSSITSDDLLAVDHVTRGYVGETFNLMYRENYKWFYLNAQRPDEVTLFKMYDSDPGVPARSKLFSFCVVVTYADTDQIAPMHLFSIKSYHRVRSHERVSR